MQNEGRRYRLSKEEVKLLCKQEKRDNRYTLTAKEEKILLNNRKPKQPKQTPISNVISAWDNNGKVMDIDAYCEFYNLPRNDIKSYKLVTHSGTPFYNIQFHEKHEELEFLTPEFLSHILEKNLNNNPIKIKVPKRRNKSITRGIYTDVHIGMHPNKQGISLYGGVWNQEEQHKRILDFSKDLILRSKINSSNKIIIDELGDFVDGWDGMTVRRGHSLPQNMTNEEAFDQAVKMKVILCDLLVYSEMFSEIVFNNVCNDNHCFTQDVEVLTDNGWKLYENILNSDTIATVNLENNNVEYQKPLRYIFNPGCENLEVHNYNSKTLDISVTSEHRMLVKRNKYNKSNRKYSYELSKDICDVSAKAKMMVSGIQNNKDLDIDDDFIRLCAWINTDGTVTSSGSYYIYQSKKENICKIKNILDNLRIGYDFREKKGLKPASVCGKTLKKEPMQMYEFVINRAHTGNDDFDRIKNLIPSKKIPFWINKLSKRQFDLYLDSYIDGDGSKRIGSSATIHGLKDMMDRLQELCVINGHRAKLSKNNRGDYLLNVVFNRNFSTVDFRNVKKESYSGYTWCLTLPNSNMIVRRNGCVSVQGNSGSFGYVVNSAVKSILELKYSHVKVNNHRKFINHYTIGKHTFIISHGKDKEDSKFGFKPQLDNAGEKKITNYITSNNLTGMIEFSKGDSHQCMYDYATSDLFVYLNHPAFSPPSQWVQTNYQKGRSGYSIQTFWEDIEEVPITHPRFF